jgi:hypothetical protein
MVKSRRMRWTQYVSRMGEKRNAYRLLLGKPSLSCRWMNNIAIDLGGI